MKESGRGCLTCQLIGCLIPSCEHSSESANVSLLLLPAHIITEILVRLPPYNIFTCKCVCNAFKRILSDPDFVEIYLAKAWKTDYNLVIQNTRVSSDIILAPCFDLDKPALYSEATDNYNGGNYRSWQSLTSPPMIPKTDTWKVVFTLIGSCNGLLCLKYLLEGIEFYYVCNPILGEFTILPKAPLTDSVAGFGFCPNTKKYKILRFYHKTRNCEILTLGTVEWRKISDPPLHPSRFCSFDSSYRGNLHWIVAEPSKVRELICSFNLQTEKYFFMSLPSCIDDSRLNDPSIGTLDGLFCVSYTLAYSTFEVYVMQNYGVEESWIKKITVILSDRFDTMTMGLHNFLNNGALVLGGSWGRPLIYYDTRKGTTSDVIVEEIILQDNFTMAHLPSLISLKDIVGSKNVEQVERKILHYVPSEARVHIGRHLRR